MKGTKQGDSPEGSVELQADFDHVDSDDDGRIDFSEFKRFLEGLEAQMSESDLQIGFREIDADRDGRISFGEFATWWSQEDQP